MKGRVVVALAAVLMMVATACSGPAYDGQPFEYPNPQGIGVKPALLAINTQYVDTGVVPSNAECAFGLGVGAAATGLGAIGAVMSPPAGLAAWAVFGGSIGGGLALLGDTLVHCLNQYEITHPAWQVITQCQGLFGNGPVLTSTFDDYGAATAFINLGSCFCSIDCQTGTGVAPGLPFSSFAFQAGKNYFHDGANRLEQYLTPQQSTQSMEATDWNALAASMGLTYSGCVDGDSHVSRCPS